LVRTVLGVLNVLRMLEVLEAGNSSVSYKPIAGSTRRH
jgi:hypothetical protein